MLKGYIDEVFVSVQGEGPMVGTPMLFIRLGGCQAGCERCDTPRARTQMSQFTFHGATAEAIPNPVSVAELVVKTTPILKRLPFLAVTGGEPLEQPGFISLLLTRLSDTGKRVLLESRGFHYQELGEILHRVDVVAVDIKLPSFSGKPIPVEETRAFLHLATQKTCYVKVVVGPDTLEDEVVQAARLVAQLGGHIPFVVQPRYDANQPPPPPTEAKRLLGITVRLYSILPDVRLIPQTQRYLGIK
jgi:7-carboxy-7-deazaguanine synthase